MLSSLTDRINEADPFFQEILAESRAMKEVQLNPQDPQNPNNFSDNSADHLALVPMNQVPQKGAKSHDSKKMNVLSIPRIIVKKFNTLTASMMWLARRDTYAESPVLCFSKSTADVIAQWDQPVIGQPASRMPSAVTRLCQ
jgi:hypothetical protein